MNKRIDGLLLFFVLQLFTLKAFAITSDTLFLSSNEKGSGVFNIYNNNSDRVFINTEMVKVDVKDGKIEKTDLDKSNVLSWGIAVEPGKFILNPNEVINVGVKALCQQDSCKKDYDDIYQIRFMPAEVHEDDADSQQRVNIKFSVAPFFVIPASPQRVDYQYDYDEEKQVMTFENTGNTFLKIQVNNCTKFDKNKRTCQAMYFSLAGTKKRIALPDSLISEHTIIKVANHDQSVQKQINL
ncbi:hypothetical protein HPX47_004639 [Vibrio alginolyticus]|nr:hypothetical protein [Vibrio alginolyticus]